MKDLLDAFWRAAAYCLHPRVIGLSLLPLLIGAVLAWLGWWLYWDSAVAAVQSGLPGWPIVGSVVQWIERFAGDGVRAVLAPSLIVALSLPVVVVVSVLLVGLLMTSRTACMKRSISNGLFRTGQGHRSLGPKRGRLLNCMVIALSAFV